MKKYIITVCLFLITSFLSGCYTVVWDPDEELPDAQTYEEEYYDDGGYYQDPYYGDYGYYYEYPWWLTISQGATTSGGGSKANETSTRSDNSTMDRIRNRDGSRDTGTERIITNSPDASSGSSGSSSSSGKTSTSTGSNNRREEAKSSDTKDNTNTSTRSGSTSTDSNRTRNNDGGRNDGGRKR
jgi:hypothetical protein